MANLMKTINSIMSSTAFLKTVSFLFIIAGMVFIAKLLSCFTPSTSAEQWLIYIAAASTAKNAVDFAFRNVKD